MKILTQEETINYIIENILHEQGINFGDNNDVYEIKSILFHTLRGFWGVIDENRFRLIHKNIIQESNHTIEVTNIGNQIVLSIVKSSDEKRKNEKNVSIVFSNYQNSHINSFERDVKIVEYNEAKLTVERIQSYFDENGTNHFDHEILEFGAIMSKLVAYRLKLTGSSLSSLTPENMMSFLPYAHRYYSINIGMDDDFEAKLKDKSSSIGVSHLLYSKNYARKLIAKGKKLPCAQAFNKIFQELVDRLKNDVSTESIKKALRKKS